MACRNCKGVQYERGGRVVCASHELDTSTFTILNGTILQETFSMQKSCLGFIFFLGRALYFLLAEPALSKKVNRFKFTVFSSGALSPKSVPPACKQDFDLSLYDISAGESRS